MTPRLDETTADQNGAYRTLWYCDPPATGVKHIVTDQAWADDYNTRLIYRWEPADGR